MTLIERVHHSITRNLIDLRQRPVDSISVYYIWIQDPFLQGSVRKKNTRPL